MFVQPKVIVLLSVVTFLKVNKATIEKAMLLGKNVKNVCM